MLKIQSNMFNYLWVPVLVVVLLLLIPLMEAGADRLKPFTEDFSPREGLVWYTFDLIIWVYANIFWVITWLYSWILWLSPIIIPGLALSIARDRKRIRLKGYKKLILSKSKNLAKSWRKEQGFGYDQIRALTNVVHLALSDNTKRKSVSSWFELGFRHGSKEPDSLLKKLDLEFKYDSLTALPILWANGKPTIVD